MSTRCQVLGDPIAHSLSPVLHRAGYAALGLTGWTYDAVRVPSGGLPAHLASLGRDWRGLSLTMPLKREALALADAMSDVVELAGAANTLVCDGETVYAENTDVPGAAAAIRERWTGALDRAVIVGGGATATSVGLALADLGCGDLRLLVRSPERAAETVRALGGHPDRPRVDVGDLAAVPSLAGADLLVSTVPAEGQGPALVEASAEVPALFEVVYHPWPTPLAAAALAGARTLIGGLDLLAHQARLQFELFTGHEVAVDVLRDAGIEALASR